jgi:hypothetical protein
MTGQPTTTWRTGEWVEVRSKEEILKTLDHRGELDGMPFMPEMLAFAGRRLRVVSSAHKTCDTIKKSGGRSVVDAIHLDDVRCDGAAHDGCQAGCLIFWKGAWIKKADDQAGHSAPATSGPGCTEEELLAATKAPNSGADGKGPTYSCQTTELLRATTPLPWWNVRQYIQDYRTGNVTLGQMVKGAAYAVPARMVRAARHRPRLERLLISTWDRVTGLWGGTPFPRRRGSIPSGAPTPPCKLNLQEGELVRIKSYQEITATLDHDNRNRGMFFDAEMVPFCGGTYRVRTRVNKIIDENNGKMVEFKSPSVILDGVACQSRYSDRRMFCPRAIYSFWREIWLERVDQNGAAAVGPKTTSAPAPQATTPSHL